MVSGLGNSGGHRANTCRTEGRGGRRMKGSGAGYSLGWLHSDAAEVLEASHADSILKCQDEIDSGAEGEE